MREAVSEKIADKLRGVPLSAGVRDKMSSAAVADGRARHLKNRWPGGWKCFPEPLPEDHLLERETLELIDSAIAELPDRQHTVITLRDIEGWSSEEVCQALAISEANQRVLLHRARSKVRRCLEAYLEPTPALT